MDPQQQIDPLTLLLKKHVGYLDRDGAFRVGRLIKISKDKCTIQHKITIVKQKNGRFYPPINHRIERHRITATIVRGKIVPLTKTNKKIEKLAKKNGIDLIKDKMPTPVERFRFKKAITKTEIIYGFLIIAKKAGMGIGDKVIMRMNGWRVTTHVQSSKRIRMAKEMKTMDLEPDDILNFDVTKKAGKTIITITPEGN